MTLGFGDSPSNLFNRIGRIGSVIKAIRACQNSNQANLIDGTIGLNVYLANEPDLQSIVGSNYVGILNGLMSSSSTLQNLAAKILSRMIYRDQPLPGQNLTTINTVASIQQVIIQMFGAGATVLQQAVTNTNIAFTGVGNGALNSSLVRPQDGRNQELAFAEMVSAACSNDSYTGTATAGNETIQIFGQGAQSNVFAFDWPRGSGSSTNVNAINGNSNNTAGNILTNSGFEAFTSNLPNNFTFLVGTGGTNVFEEDTLIFDPVGGGKALRLLGDGSTLINFSEAFNSSTGTRGSLAGGSQYSFCMWLRRDAVAVGAGLLEISLVDSLGNYIQDVAGNNNTFTIDLTTLNTAYSPFKWIFRTPNVMPNSYLIRYRLTTAITSGRNVYLDKGSLGSTRQLYSSGPYFAVHSGSVPFEIGDVASCTITNARGSGGTLDTFQTLWQRLFYAAMMSNEFLLPSSNVPFISDGLI